MEDKLIQNGIFVNSKVEDVIEYFEKKEEEQKWERNINGWEVIKAIEDNEFKEGTILKDSLNTYRVQGTHLYICAKDIKEMVNCWNLINNHFEIQEDKEIDIQRIEELNYLEMPSDANTREAAIKKINAALSNNFSKINEIIRVVNKMQEYYKESEDRK